MSYMTIDEIGGEVEVSTEEDREAMLADDVLEAKSLRQRVGKLVDGFMGVDAPHHSKEQYEMLLDDMLDFERRVLDFDLLSQFYEDIAIISINAQSFRNAHSYSNAFLELSRRNGDNEGVTRAFQLLCNLGMLTKNFETGIGYYMQAYPGATDRNDRFLAETDPMASMFHNDFAEYDMSKKIPMPRTFAFMLGSEEGIYESTARWLVRDVSIKACSV